MATRFSSFVTCILYIYSFSAFLCLHAHEARETTESYHLHYTHTVQVSSLIPSSTCTASTKGLTLSLSLSLSQIIMVITALYLYLYSYCNCRCSSYKAKNQRGKKLGYLLSTPLRFGKIILDPKTELSIDISNGILENFKRFSFIKFSHGQ